MLSLTLRLPGESLSRMAPDGAVAYLEVDDVATLAEKLSETRAWTLLAPAVGWPQRLAGVSFLRRFMNLVGFGQEPLDVLLTSRVAAVVTGLEIDGGEMTPHLALMVRPATRIETERWIQAQLKVVADRAYANWAEETSDYAGRQIHSIRSQDGAHRMFWCVLDQVALIANRPDAIQVIIETNDQRRPSLESNQTFQHLRATQPAAAPLFGYVNTQPVAKGLQQSAWPSGSSSTQGALLANALQIFFAAFEISLSYHLDVEDGIVVEQYHLPRSTEFSHEIAQAVMTPQTVSHSLDFIPQGSRSFTILHLGDPEKLLERLDTLLTRRLSAISSIALREIIIRLKRTWGLNEQDTLADAIGDEVTVVEGEHPDLLLIIQAKRKAKLAAIIGQYLQQGGTATRTAQYGGLEIYSSTDQTRKAFCFVGDTLLMGPIDLIKWALDARQQKMTIERAAEVKALIDKYGRGAVEISVRLDRRDEARRVAATLQGFSSRPLDADQILDRFRSLPPTIRTTRLSPEGLFSETRSPLGDVPFWLIENE